MLVKYSDLDLQFPDVDTYLDDIRELVRTADFTLGAAVAEFEGRFAKLCGLRYAVGVSSGTDALALSMKACGVGPGDEVITTPNTFVATVGAIVMNGARPVFVDNNDEYTIDVKAMICNTNVTKSEAKTSFLRSRILSVALSMRRSWSASGILFRKRPGRRILRIRRENTHTAPTAIKAISP